MLNAHMPDQETRKRERKKEQNRVAQRNYRNNQRKKRDDLEATVGRLNDVVMMLTQELGTGNDIGYIDLGIPSPVSSSIAIAHDAACEDMVLREANMGLDNPPTSSVDGQVETLVDAELFVDAGALAEAEPMPQAEAMVDTQPIVEAERPAEPIEPHIPPVVPAASRPLVKCTSTWTPLQLAIHNGNESMVNLLISRGANLLLRDGRGATALHLAVEAGHESLVRLALDSSIDPNLTDCLGRTALFIAVQNEQCSIVQLLLGTKTVNINHRDMWDKAPLHMAVQLNSEALVLLLIEHGAKVDM